MIRALVIVRCTRFDAQNQDLARAQIQALRHVAGLRVGVERSLHQRPERDGGKNVHVTVQVVAIHRDQEVARSTLEGIEVTRQPRVAEIERRDSAVDLVREYSRGKTLVRGLTEREGRNRAQNTWQQEREK